MNFRMVLLAKPNDFERLGVFEMMRLAFNVSAYNARLPLNPFISQRVTKSRLRRSFISVSLSPIPHSVGDNLLSPRGRSPFAVGLFMLFCLPLLSAVGIVTRLAPSGVPNGVAIGC